MADNTTLNLGSGGDVIASDDIGGVKHQRVKLSLGADGTAADAPVGGGTESGVLRVTLASDSTGVLSVDDNGSTLSIDDGAGSITVDNGGTFAVQATLAAETTKVIGTVNIASAQTIATVTTVSAVTAISNALPAGNNNIGDVDIASALPAGTNNIGDVDVLSVVPGTGATALGKAEDAAHTSGDVGVMALAVRRDADTTLADTTGDYAPLQVNAAGSLKVAITSGAGSGGTSIADGASFTRDSTSLTPIGGVVETSAPTVTAGDAVALSLTTGGALRVAVASGGIAGVVEDAASAGGEEGVMVLAVRRDSASSGVGADGDFAALSVTSDGSLRVSGGGGGTQYAVDTAGGGTDTGTLALVVRDDALATLTPVDGDYTQVRVNARGAQWVALDSTVAQTVTLAAGTATNEIVGDAAQDAAIAGNPVAIGLRASTATPTAMSGDGDVVYAWADRTGAQVVVGNVLDDAAFTPGTNRVTPVGYLADETATDSVDEGDIGAARITLDRKLIVTSYAHAAGGATPGRILSAASTNGTVVKASPGSLYSLIVTNTNAAVRYLKVYNSTSVTVGTTTPTWTIAIPGAATGAGFAVPIPECGVTFGTGICLGLTTGAADNDTGAVAANEICVSYAYV